jgi:hypothetical protein
MASRAGRASRWSLVVGVAAVVGIGAGCGGEEATSGTTVAAPKPPTKAEYIVELDRLICEPSGSRSAIRRDWEKANEKLNEALQAGRDGAPELRAELRVWERNLADRRKLTTRLEAIEAPAAGPSRYFELRAKADAALVDLIGTLRKAVGKPPHELARTYQRVYGKASRAQVRATKASTAYGICKQEAKAKKRAGQAKRQGEEQ